MSASDCPLCGEPNRCALASPEGGDAPCWCVGRDFSPALLARAPDRSACICEACRRAQAESPAGDERED